MGLRALFIVREFWRHGVSKSILYYVFSFSLLLSMHPAGFYHVRTSRCIFSSSSFIRIILSPSDLKNSNFYWFLPFRCAHATVIMVLRVYIYIFWDISDNKLFLPDFFDIYETISLLKNWSSKFVTLLKFGIKFEHFEVKLQQERERKFSVSCNRTKTILEKVAGRLFYSQSVPQWRSLFPT